MITGDAIHSSAQCGHPGWHFRYDTDPEAAVTSRRCLLEMAAETGPEVLGSHFTLPSRGRVRAKGDAFCVGSRWPDTASSVCRRSRACLCRCKVY
jgi:glyoxylase-like metal-dependent hydrolase (beta-lactamase superfamily II)